MMKKKKKKKKKKEEEEEVYSYFRESQNDVTRAVLGVIVNAQ